jgi:hypothetical protein
MKSGFGAVDRLLRSPIFCFQQPETAENAGVLFAFLYSYKERTKVFRRRESNLENAMNKGTQEE